MHFRMLALLAAAVPFALSNPADAGVSNPDLSALGQVIGGYTDDKASPDHDEATLQSGEMELLLDANLNPFFKASFTVAGSEDGFEMEEGYASMVRGLPWGLGLMAGKRRLDFGKINPVHPHAYPFIIPPRSLVSLLPGGEEGFNETGVQVSDLLPTPGDWASTVSAELIQADQFHPDRDFSKLGWLGRWSNDFLIGDIGALETGLSFSEGHTISPEWDPAWLYGADAKVKFYLPGSSQLTLQAEGAYRRFPVERIIEGETAVVEDNRGGFVGFVDYRYHTRWNGGLFYEQWGREGETDTVDRNLRAFVGFSVLEESTLLRLMAERYLPEGEAAVNSLTLQFMFSMGPHKAHRF